MGLLSVTFDVDLHLQPIFRLETREIVGYESLMRSPCGTIGPLEMLELTRQNGTWTELEHTLREKGLRLCEQVLRAPERLFFNLDPRVESPHFAQCSLDQIAFEIPEYIPVTPQSPWLATLQRYRAQGAKIYLDDFGIGHSNLGAVLLIRPDGLKIDRLLVQRIDADPMRQALIRTVLELCDRLNMCCVAEGIERPEELETLVQLGVPLGQGFFLGKPVPVTGAKRIPTKR